MVNEELEIRGIARKDIINYLVQIGAVIYETNCPLAKGNNWSCHVFEEKYFRMFQSDIPKVKLIFEAHDKVTLNDVLTKFRKKTFRAGG